MTNTTSNLNPLHACARTLFDGVECDMQEHAGMGCTGCCPYIHSDMTLDHEPGCTAIEIVVTTEPDNV